MKEDVAKNKVLQVYLETNSDFNSISNFKSPISANICTYKLFEYTFQRTTPAIRNIPVSRAHECDHAHTSVNMSGRGKLSYC